MTSKNGEDQQTQLIFVKMFEDIKNTYWLCEVMQYLKMYNMVYVIVSGGR